MYRHRFISFQAKILTLIAKPGVSLVRPRRFPPTHVWVYQKSRWEANLVFPLRFIGDDCNSCGIQYSESLDANQCFMICMVKRHPEFHASGFSRHTGRTDFTNCQEGVLIVVRYIYIVYM